MYCENLRDLEAGEDEKGRPVWLCPVCWRLTPILSVNDRRFLKSIRVEPS